MLSTVHRRTLEAFYRHPIAHNLDRIDVLSLFAKLGSVEHGENSAVTYTIGDEHHRVTKSRGHSLMTDEVMALRHLLTRAGWGTDEHGSPNPPMEAVAPNSDWLVVLEATEARLFHLDLRANDKSGHTIHARNPHRILCHFSHAEQGRDAEKRNTEEARFFDEITKALLSGGKIVLVGHGAGHSNTTQQFSKYLHTHHPLIFKRVVNAVVADIGQMTDGQLLELARTALTA